MRVFMSWSGERSRLVGELLDEWLQCVIQAINPWMSTKDIERGALWFAEINNQLKEISVGVIILTDENKDKPWILFEAGALAKGLTTNRVCVILVDLQPGQVRDPLAQFNLTLPTREGIWQLVSTLNSALQEKSLKEKVLAQVFDTYWPQFEEKFDEIIQDTVSDVPKENKTIATEELLYEIISNTRNINKRLNRLERSEKKSDVLSSSDIRQMVDYLEDGAPDEFLFNFFGDRVSSGAIKRAIDVYREQRPNTDAG